MGTKSKFFRAFVEGQTISDGRKIEAAWIDQIAETFNAETYTPRINVEHISGYSPEPPFNGYGSVVAVKVQTDDIEIAGKTEKRKALYCQVDANDQLVTLAGKDQKPFPSVELTDSYAGTGKVGLIGLAFTDKPASTATQKLQFSRSAPGTLFSHGDAALSIEFEAAPQDAAGLAATVAAAVAGVFSRLGLKPAAEPEKAKETPPPPANDNAALFTAIGEAVSTGIAAALAPVNTKLATVDQLAGDFATMKTQLEKTEAPGFSRAPASGVTGSAVATDC